MLYYNIISIALYFIALYFNASVKFYESFNHWNNDIVIRYVLWIFLQLHCINEYNVCRNVWLNPPYIIGLSAELE